MNKRHFSLMGIGDSLEKLYASQQLIEDRLGYFFSDSSLLWRAFTHKSFANENRESAPHYNERLEFLGDAVLGLIMSDYLYQALPEEKEGVLSELKSRLVEASACVRYMQVWGLSDLIMLGKGERQSEKKDSIIADLFEAIVGAIYLDGGLDAARGVLMSSLKPVMAELTESPDHNWKGMLQDYVQKHMQIPPSYQVINEEGPDHQKIFYVEVSIKGVVVGSGQGPSKKEAERSAAENALMKGIDII